MNVPNTALIQAMIELGEDAMKNEQLKKLLVIAYNEGAIWGLSNGKRNDYGKPTGKTKKLIQKANALINELRKMDV